MNRSTRSAASAYPFFRSVAQLHDPWLRLHSVKFRAVSSDLGRKKQFFRSVAQLHGPRPRLPSVPFLQTSGAVAWGTRAP